jgi:hypothetical protein
LTSDEIRNHWEKRWAEIQEQRAKQAGKGKGKTDPSPWVPYVDLALAVEHLAYLQDLVMEYSGQLAAVEASHQKEIEHLKAQHALNVQKIMRGI